MTTVTEALESQLRRIEVRRLFDEPGELLPPDEMADTAEAFMAWSLESRDWRYLNAALKLNDCLRAHGHPRAEALALAEAACLAALRRSCGVL